MLGHAFLFIFNQSNSSIGQFFHYCEASRELLLRSVEYALESRRTLVRLLQAESERGGYEHAIAFGELLSGAARIFSRHYLAELLRLVPGVQDGIIGGEMEGVGLTSVSPRKKPLWIVVKGICDFADENRDAEIEKTRPIACGNAARFVLSALLRAKQARES